MTTSDKAMPEPSETSHLIADMVVVLGDLQQFLGSWLARWVQRKGEADEPALHAELVAQEAASQAALNNLLRTLMQVDPDLTAKVFHGLHEVCSLSMPRSDIQSPQGCEPLDGELQSVVRLGMPTESAMSDLCKAVAGYRETLNEVWDGDPSTAAGVENGLASDVGVVTARIKNVAVRLRALAPAMPDASQVASDTSIWSFPAGGVVLLGKPLAISGKPRLVIQALAKAPNHSLTRNALMDAVWPQQIVSHRTVASTISTARKALTEHLELPSSIDPIECIDRGQDCAYRLNESALREHLANR